MAKLFLQTSKTEGGAKLYARFRLGSKVLWVSTGYTVDVKEWRKAEKSIAAMTRLLTKDEMIKKLLQCIDDNRDKIRTAEDKQILVDAFSRIVNAEVYKADEYLKEKEKKDAEQAKKSILGFYNYFMDGIQSGMIKHGGKNYSDGSVKVWKGFGNYLREYLHDNADVTFDDITKPFADKFITLLEHKQFMAKSINKNTICFRKLCNLAAEEGINNNAVSLKVWKEKTVGDEEKKVEVYLTTDELDALYNMKLEGMKDQARDLFFLGYLSCQRFSDYGRLTRKNFVQTESGLTVIALTQKKTGTYVEVPVTDGRVLEICEKYNFKFPVMSDQKINRYIRLALKELSLSLPSLKEEHSTLLSFNERRSERNYMNLYNKVVKGMHLTTDERNEYMKLKTYAEEHGNEDGKHLFARNAAEEVVKYKYELITSHTARRSGVTNLYKTGLLDTREMMSISGHRSEKVFEKYIRVGTREQAERVAAKLSKQKEGNTRKEEFPMKKE